MIKALKRLSQPCFILKQRIIRRYNLKSLNLGYFHKKPIQALDLNCDSKLISNNFNILTSFNLIEVLGLKGVKKNKKINTNL